MFMFTGATRLHMNLNSKLTWQNKCVRWPDEYIAIHIGNSSGNTGQGKQIYFSSSILGNFYT